MIYGIGVDMEEVDRMRKAAESRRFLERWFTSGEIELFAARKFNPQTITGNFAAKEAFAKALGTGFSGFTPGDVEVLRDKTGKPYIQLFQKAAAEAEHRGIAKIHVSISNTEKYACAFVICESLISL